MPRLLGAFFLTSLQLGESGNGSDLGNDAAVGGANGVIGAIEPILFSKRKPEKASPSWLKVLLLDLDIEVRRCFPEREMGGVNGRKSWSIADLI